MVKVVIKLLDSGKQETFIGSERDAEHRLRALFPRETEHTGRLLSCIAAINAEGFGEVDIAPYKEPPERNLLPKDYDQPGHREDPWPRSE
jgi:hypothetical protein